MHPRSTSPAPRLRAWRLTAALTLLMLGVSLLVPLRGHAHGALRRADPAAGAQLTTAPRELRLTFTEPVELSVARLRLVGPDSADVELGPLSLHPDSANVLVAAVRGGIVTGTYTVAWQVSSADGHPVRGTYTFDIAQGASGLAAPTAAPGAEPPPAARPPEPAALPLDGGFDAESPPYVAVRWLTYLALAGVIGAVAFRFAVIPLARRQDRAGTEALLGPAARRAAGVGLAAAALCAVAALLRLYAQSYALHGAGQALEPAPLGTMLRGTLWGWGWLLQAGATVLALAGFAAARSRASQPVAELARAEPAPVLVAAGHGGGPVAVDGEGAPAGAESAAPVHDLRPGAWTAAGLGALALAFAPALSGHAAAAASLRGATIFADGVHVLAAGGWVGGLLVLIAAGIPAALRLEGEARGPAVAALVTAFSPAALAFAAALTLTGVFAAWVHLGSIPALWESGYGRTLLLKLAVLSVVFGIGAYNWLRVRPALGDERGAVRIRRSASVEIAVGAIVLLVTAVLVATPPPGH